MTSSLQRYIIVGPARSGTTVTHLCLAGHPNVSAVTDEVKVRPFFTEGLSTFTHGNDPASEKQAGFLALFDTLCALNAPADLKACGLKTALSSTEEANDFVQSVQANFPQVKIVLTLRDDIVAQFGSFERAKATGRWHSWVKPGKTLDEMLHLDDRRLHNHALDYLRTVEKLRSLKESHEIFEISFEKDILPGERLIYHQLFRFLGLPDAEITWLKSEKVAPAPEAFIADYARHCETVHRLREQFAADPEMVTVYPSLSALKFGLLQRVRRKFLRD